MTQPAFASTADNPVTVSSSTGATVTLSAQASATQASDGLTIEWTTSGLPEDISFPKPRRRRGQRPVGLRRLLGDQSSPWARRPAAVGAALGGVCGTPAQTSVSRYQVYRYEISLGANAGGISDWSGRNGWASNGQPDPQGSENPGRPLPDRERRAVLRQRAGGQRRRHHDRRYRSAQSDRADHQLSRSNGARQHYCAGASSKTPVAAFGSSS